MTPPSSLTAEAQALTTAYAALNRDDLPGFSEILAPDIELIEPPGFPGAGSYRGLDAVIAHFAHHRSNWAEGACHVTRQIIAGNRILQLIHVHVRLKNEPTFREGDLAEVYTFHNGKVTELRIFANPTEALQWAGVDAPSPT